MALLLKQWTLNGANNESLQEFISFVQSYVWLSVFILLLLFCTYVYEKAGIAPEGAWIASPQTSSPVEKTGRQE